MSHRLPNLYSKLMDVRWNRSGFCDRIKMMRQERPRHPIITGLIAGFLGTAAMTVAMELMFPFLPRRQQRPLPPRQITGRIAVKTGVRPYLDEDDVLAATMLAHFGYGSVAGSVYTLSVERLSLPVPLKGTIFGLGVWAGSYYGWVPGLRLFPPASQWPRGRKLLMVAAHLVWGVTLATVVERLCHSRS